jgi:hypothetical protein
MNHDSVSQPFTHGFPQADIYELPSPDLLHQIIKGTFKDHLVTWVTNYIKFEHSPAAAKRILAQIDQQYVPLVASVGYLSFLFEFSALLRLAFGLNDLACANEISVSKKCASRAVEQ